MFLNNFPNMNMNQMNQQFNNMPMNLIMNNQINQVQLNNNEIVNLDVFVMEDYDISLNKLKDQKKESILLMKIIK